jgi:P27 family predicted phage terminase small subunit
MKPGTKPKPIALRILEGNPARRPIPESIQPEGVPSCPRWLDNMAKTEWRRIVPELAAIGMLSLVDRAALSGYCTAYSRWRRAETAIQDSFTYEFMDVKTFKPKRVKKPEVQIAIDSLNQVKAFCAEFGLTPSSRVRVNPIERKKRVEDTLEDLLSGNRVN